MSAHLIFPHILINFDETQGGIIVEKKNVFPINCFNIIGLPFGKKNGNPQVKLHNTNRILIQEDIHICKSERLNKKN